MKGVGWSALLLVVAGLVLGGRLSPVPRSSASQAAADNGLQIGMGTSATGTATVTVTLTDTPTGTLPPSSTVTLSPTLPSTTTATSTSTPTSSASPTQTSTPTSTPTVSATSTATVTLTPTTTSTATATSTLSPTPTLTPTSSVSPTPTPTGSPTSRVYFPLLMRNWQFVSRIVVSPPQPTTRDTIYVRVRGQWGNSCPLALHDAHVVEGESVRIVQMLVGLTSERPQCLPVVTNWTAVERFQRLPAGAYVVEVRVIDLSRFDDPLESPWSFTDRWWFSVRP